MATEKTKMVLVVLESQSSAMQGSCMMILGAVDSMVFWLLGKPRRYGWLMQGPPGTVQLVQVPLSVELRKME